MPTAPKAATTDGSPTAADLQSVLAALQQVAEALTTNTEELRSAQHLPGTNGGDGGDGGGYRADQDRRASAEQSRTVLNYQVISQMLGRATEADLTVPVKRVRGSDGKEALSIEKVPAPAVKVAVLIAGTVRPELLDLPGQGATRVVPLGTLAEKAIDRIELLDSAGTPIRLGPRLRRPAPPVHEPASGDGQAASRN